MPRFCRGLSLSIFKLLAMAWGLIGALFFVVVVIELFTKNSIGKLVYILPPYYSNLGEALSGPIICLVTAVVTLLLGWLLNS